MKARIDESKVRSNIAETCIGESVTSKLVTHQSRTNIVKNEKGVLVSDSHSILAR